MRVKPKLSKQFIAISAWGLLGFYRGVQECNYDRKKYGSHNKKDYPELYSVKLFYGVIATCMYVNPLTGWLMGLKEAYRLEVNLRGVEAEKQTDVYNRNWWL